MATHEFLEIGDTIEAEHETIFYHVREDALLWRKVHPIELGEKVDELAYGFFRREAQQAPKLGAILDADQQWWARHDELASHAGDGWEFIVGDAEGESMLTPARLPYNMKGGFPPSLLIHEASKILGGSKKIIAMYREAGIKMTTERKK
jgi:hypothetical protein